MQMFTTSLQDHIMICIYLSVFQKGVYFSGVKIFSNLPADLKQTSHNIYKFQKALKRFLLDNAFYSLEEYYNWKENVSS